MAVQWPALGLGCELNFLDGRPLFANQDACCRQARAMFEMSFRIIQLLDRKSQTEGEYVDAGVVSAEQVIVGQMTRG